MFFLLLARRDEVLGNKTNMFIPSCEIVFHLKEIGHDVSNMTATFRSRIKLLSAMHHFIDDLDCVAV